MGLDAVWYTFENENLNQFKNEYYEKTKKHICLQ